MSSTKTSRRGASDQYLDLVRECPLRPIRTQAQYKAAAKMIDRLAVRGEQYLSRDELDYLDVLSDLVEAYDDRHYPPPDAGTPLERLKALLEESGTSTADLGRLLGSSGLASDVLRGKRQLSKSHIRLLGEHFKLDAGYFL